MGDDPRLDRRGFLKRIGVGSALTVAATGLAACSASQTTPAPRSDMSHGAGASPDVVDHDAIAAARVKHSVEGEWQKVTPIGAPALAPRVDGDTKAF